MAENKLQSKMRQPGFWRAAGAVALCYLALFALHVLIQPYADDLWYWEKADTWSRDFWGLQAEYYLTWSGRVVSSAAAFFFMYGRFWWWRVLNPLFLMALCWLVARVVVPRPTVLDAGKALLLLLLTGPGVLDYAVFWATGSFYYLWPAVGALFALVPFFDLALRGQETVRYFPVRVAAAVASCLGNEQITAAMLGLMAVVLLWRLATTRRLAALWRHLTLFLACVPPTLLLFLSPGSAERYKQESYLYYLEYYIGFYEVPFWGKIAGGVTWMFQMVFFSLYLPLVVLYAVCWWQGFARRPAWRNTALLAPGVLAVAMAFPQPVDVLFTFAPLTGILSLGLGAAAAVLLPYLFWGLFLLALGLMLARRGWFGVLVYLAAFATVCVLFFSPTIYASGQRTLFIAAVIFCALLAGRLKGPVPGAVWLALGGLAGVNTLRLLSRLQVFF